MTSGHALLGISGGVDSAVAACLLVDKGLQVTGLNIRILDNAQDNLTLEPSPIVISDDPAYSIPVYTLNLSASFRDTVIANFREEYLAGRTPNPCTLCNKEIKWKGLLLSARMLGADIVATGHYARSICTENGPELHKGIDPSKDQSYFLWMLSREELDQTLFPLGELTKPEVRELARRFSVRAAAKKESQEICFIPHNDYRAFLSSSLPGLEKQVCNGEIIDARGKVAGHHKGYPFYTIGQRRGLGISSSEPLYVNRIEPERNRIHVGGKDSLARDTLTAHSMNWSGIPAPREPFRSLARIRYRDTETPCRVIPLDRNRVEVVFDTPKQAVTAGQAVVFFRDDTVLGGGIIV
ncbi:tRNA-specific 2-thiouridylase MnmA [Prosthecochloris sp. CIB 2401]|nr:tRNA-specific 2-thiouridylase MnmA [Prosthecochloris sp. CIB 2401]